MNRFQTQAYEFGDKKYEDMLYDYNKDTCEEAKQKINELKVFDMLKRNVKIKDRPQHFNDVKQLPPEHKFDVIITCESKVSLFSLYWIVICVIYIS